MTIDEIIKLRKQLPENWQWSKGYKITHGVFHVCYETQIHWALINPANKDKVESVGLVSINADSKTRKQFLKHDIPVQFVEKSLEIVDFLLAEIEILKNKRC